MVAASPTIGPADLHVLVQRAVYADYLDAPSLTHNYLFARVKVRYSGPELFHMSPTNFAVQDSRGSLHYAVSYDASSALSAADMIDPVGMEAGYLVFHLSPTDRGPFTLIYLYTEQNRALVSQTVALARTRLTVPGSPNPTRSYALNEEGALHQYIADEALISGYVATTFSTDLREGSLRMSDSELHFIEGQRQVLQRDRRSFDSLVVPRQARWLRDKADRLFSWIDGDLDAASGGRSEPRLAAWMTRLARDTSGFTRLYQEWPSPPTTDGYENN